MIKSQKLITESSLRRLIAKEIKQQRLNEHASRMLEESNSKNAIIGSVLAMLAGAGLLTKDKSFDEIKQQAQSMISSSSSSTKSIESAKTASEVFNMLERFCRQNLEPTEMILHYIYETSPLSYVYWGKTAAQHATGFEKTINVASDTATKNYLKLSARENLEKDLETIKKINANFDQNLLTSLSSLNEEELKSIKIDKKKYPGLREFMETFKMPRTGKPSSPSMPSAGEFEDLYKFRGDNAAKYFEMFKAIINAIEKNTEKTLNWLKEKEKNDGSLKGKSYYDIMTQIKQTNLEKTAKDLGMPEGDLLHWISKKSPKIDRSAWTTEEDRTEEPPHKFPSGK